MTREEANALVNGVWDSAWPGYKSKQPTRQNWLVDSLVALDLLKLDEPTDSALEALSEALADTVAENGRLTAARVNQFLEERGFQIFWAPFTSKNKLHK